MNWFVILLEKVKYFSFFKYFFITTLVLAFPGGFPPAIVSMYDPCTCMVNSDNWLNMREHG